MALYYKCMPVQNDDESSSTILHARMSLFCSIRDVALVVLEWRKKTLNWYRNASDLTLPLSTETAPPPAASTNIETSTNAMTTMTTEAMMVDNTAELQAVASGVDKQAQTGRKGRVRKASTTPRLAGVAAKKKVAKPPRNPFRRSETGKLQLKRLQMGKRVETMTPRVDVLRERLNTMQGRLDFVSGKLKLVVEELTTRSTEEATTTAADTPAANVTTSDADTAAALAGGKADEDIELDDEVVEADATTTNDVQ